MVEPTPERGVLRWASYHAVRDRAKFWVGSVGLVAVVVGVSTQVSDLRLASCASSRCVRSQGREDHHHRFPAFRFRWNDNPLVNLFK